MPYITQDMRDRLDAPVQKLCLLIGEQRGKAGQVNYVITKLLKHLISQQGCSYAILNEFIGALECCKLELYRRIVSPYEDYKITQNGDVT